VVQHWNLRKFVELSKKYMLCAVIQSHRGKASKNGEIAENGKTKSSGNEEHLKNKAGTYLTLFRQNFNSIYSTMLFELWLMSGNRLQYFNTNLVATG
jgi:hypothetical protein